MAKTLRVIPPPGSELDLGETYTGVAGSCLTHSGDTVKPCQ